MGTERFIFTAEGHNKVIKAYDSVGDAAERAGKRAESAFSGGLRGPRQRSNRSMVRQQKRTWREAEREAERRRKRIARSQDKEIRSLERKLMKEQRLEERAAKKRRQFLHKENQKRIRAEERMDQRRRQARSRRIRGVARGAKDAAFGLIGMAAAGASLVGGMAVRQGVDLQDRSTRLAIQGGQASQAQSIREGFESTATRVRGASASDVAGGVEAFVTKTGRLDLARNFQDLMAEMSVATGATATSLGDAMADLFQKFDITAVDDMSEAMATLAVQGKKGSFELKDAASQFPRLAAAAQRLGIGKGAEAVGTLGGLTQIARSSTGSPEEAATALENVFTMLTTKGDQLKKSGVRVFDKQGGARNIVDVLTETVANVGGTDIEKKKGELAQIFGRRGIRALSPLIQAYAEAQGDATEKTKAVNRVLTDAIEVQDAEKTMREDLAAAQETAGASLTAAWEQLKSAVSQQATPAFIELAGKLADVASKTDFTVLGTMASSTASALGFLVDQFSWAAEAIGMSVSDSRPPEQRRDAAQGRLRMLKAQRLDLYRGAFGGTAGAFQPSRLEDAGKSVAAEQARRLEKQIAEQEGIINKAEGELTAAQPDLQGHIGRDEFVNRAAEMIPGLTEGMSREAANNLADQIAEDPRSFNTTGLKHGAMGVLGGEELQSLISNYVESQMLQGMGAGEDVRASDHSRAQSEASQKVAADLSAAAQAAQQIRDTLESTSPRESSGLGL